MQFFISTFISTVKAFGLFLAGTFTLNGRREAGRAEMLAGFTAFWAAQAWLGAAGGGWLHAAFLVAAVMSVGLLFAAARRLRDAGLPRWLLGLVLVPAIGPVALTLILFGVPSR